MSKSDLSKHEIMHLAGLAGLHLTETEIDKLRKQLSETLAYVDNLNQLNTKKTAPTNQTTQLTNVYFEDGTKNERELKNEDALENTNKKNAGMFIVPRIKHGI